MSKKNFPAEYQSKDIKIFPTGSLKTDRIIINKLLMARETWRKKRSPIVHCGKRAGPLLVARWSIRFNFNNYHYLNVKPQVLWACWSKCHTLCSLQRGEQWKCSLNPEVTTAKPPSQTCCRIFSQKLNQNEFKKSPNNDQLMTCFFYTISKLERKLSQGISYSVS